MAQAKDGLAHRKWRRRATHHACCVTAWRTRVTRVLTHDVEHVPKVEPHSSYANEHLAIDQLRDINLRLHKQVRNGAALVEVQPPCAFQS
jgi:hypothetical protein